MIVTDDMRATDWRALPKTLAALSEARFFPNYMIDCPLCNPSRSTMLTGQYVHNNGVLWNEGDQNGGYPVWLRERLDRETVSFALQQAGYRTGMIGKFFGGYATIEHRPAGWDRWVGMIQHRYMGSPLDVDGTTVKYAPRDYLTDVLSGYATEFIESTPIGQPLFMFLGSLAPHNGSENGRPIPAERHMNRFRTSVVARDPAFNEADVSDKPASIAALPVMTPEVIAAMDLLERDRLRSLLAVDESIIEIIDTLRRTGRLDNTYIFIASDNGFQIGQHRIAFGKAVQYQDSVRVPMLAWGPAFKKGEDRRLVANCDLAPTIARLAKTRLPKADGIALNTRGRRDYVLLQIMPEAQVYPTHGWGLRSAQLLYFEHESGEREYYDLRTDPWEVNNRLAA
ncbi:MAG: sulfatase family protein, partial [Thermomicrobiales bacterium]